MDSSDYSNALDAAVYSLKSGQRQLEDLAQSYAIVPDVVDRARQVVSSAIDTLDVDLREALNNDGGQFGSVERCWAVAMDLYDSTAQSIAATCKWDGTQRVGVLDAMRTAASAVGDTVTSAAKTTAGLVPWVVLGLGLLVLLSFRKAV